MLIPREYIPAVSALTKFGTKDQLTEESAYVPQEEEEDEQ